MGSGILLMLASALLVVAGLPKLSARASVPWLPEPLWRPAGLAEVALGAWGLLRPGQGGAVAVAATYVVLSVALLVSILRSEEDCGCFGVEPVRPQWSHLALDLVLAAAAAIAAVDGWQGAQGAIGVVAVGLSLVAAALLAELLSTAGEIRRLRTSIAETR